MPVRVPTSQQGILQTCGEAETAVCRVRKTPSPPTMRAHGLTQTANKADSLKDSLQQAYSSNPRSPARQLVSTALTVLSEGLATLDRTPAV